MTFEELYQQLLKESVETGQTPTAKLEVDPKQLDCLLHPEKYPPVWRIGNCSCSSDHRPPCVASCIFDAFVLNETGGYDINKDVCVGCGACIEHCPAERLIASKDILPALDAVRQAKGPVYALVAPAFIGQFQPEVTPGRLRTAFKQLGFDGMIEVALFADILTLKEALEFDRNILTEKDYQLTSCCCPMWIAMIRKIYHQLMPHVPGSVSPMIACGRTVKALHPEAVTIFIGPCMAKKAEAREVDIADAIDYVLTFQEISDVFQFAGIDPMKLEESDKDHSSRAGRIYARTGGVSEAVQSTVERLNPYRKITVRTKQANGVPECREMINQLMTGESDANFFEGMGCVGGCVGGPKRIIDPSIGRSHVNAYGNESSYATPIDNPYVIELLHRLGFDTIESLLEHSDIFTRDFSK